MNEYGQMACAVSTLLVGYIMGLTSDALSQLLSARLRLWLLQAQDQERKLAEEYAAEVTRVREEARSREVTP